MDHLKPVTEKDRLYLEMKTIYDRLWRVLREYEAVSFVGARESSELQLLDPATGQAFKKSESPRSGDSRGIRGEKRSARNAMDR